MLHGLLDSVRSMARAAIGSERTASLRMLLGRVEIETLGADALDEFAVALSRWEKLSHQEVAALLRDGVVVAARRRGKLVGCVCVTADQTIAHAFLQKRAQGLGLETAMLDRVMRAAEVRGLPAKASHLDPSQPGFIAAMQGFALGPGKL